LRQLIRQEEARETVARLLHDDLSQSLLSINLGLYRLSCACKDDNDLSELIAEMRGLLTSSSRVVRRITTDFRPHCTLSHDLRALLHALAEYAQIEYGLRVTTITPDVIPLSPDYAIALRHLLQLTLNSIGRNSLATLPTIRARCEDLLLNVEIYDEGYAIHETLMLERTEALEEVCEWIRALGGKLWSGASNHSVILAFALPLPRDPSA
jgi:signal transduction histidine kinase